MYLSVGISSTVSVNHVEMVVGIGHHGREPVDSPAAYSQHLRHFSQGQVRGNQTAHDEHKYLNHIGIANYFHTAQRDDDGKNAQTNDNRMELIGPHEVRQGEGTEEQNRCQVNEDVEKQPENGHNQTDGFVVTLAQKLRHREDAVLEVDRNKPDRHNNEGNGSQPFINRNGHTHRKPTSRHTDELLGRNVGSNQRGADGPPSQ